MKAYFNSPTIHIAVAKWHSLRKIGITLVMSMLYLIGTSAGAVTPAERLSLLGYDIPEAQYSNVIAQEKVALEKAKKQRNWLYNTLINQSGEKNQPIDLARNHYPRIKPAQEKLCPLHSDKDIANCIANIRAKPDYYRAALQPYQKALQDIARLQQATPEALRSVFPDELIGGETPMPTYSSILVPAFTHNALLALDHPEQATTAICQQISFGKKLILSHDSIIQSLVGAKIVEIQLDLLGTVIKNTPLPASCQPALQPLNAADISICPLAKREALLMKNEVSTIGDMPFLYRQKATTAHIDADFNRYCQPAWQTAITQDDIAQTLPKLTPSADVCKNNSQGCVLLSHASLELELARYQNILQDSNAYLRLWQAAQSSDCSTNPDTTTWASSRAFQAKQQQLSIRTYNQRNRKDYQMDCLKQ